MHLLSAMTLLKHGALVSLSNKVFVNGDLDSSLARHASRTTRLTALRSTAFFKSRFGIDITMGSSGAKTKGANTRLMSEEALGDSLDVGNACLKGLIIKKADCALSALAFLIIKASIVKANKATNGRHYRAPRRKPCCLSACESLDNAF
jgi:hypothetical protein